MAELTVISLGWGVQSFTLAAMSALGDLPPVDFAIHADTTWERSTTYEFAAKWAPWLEEHGIKVVTVYPPERLRDPGYTINKGSTCLPVYSQNGQLRRQCTGEWKLMPMRRYLRPLAKHITMLIGISQDEWYRAKDPDVKYISHRFPLLDLSMTRAGCIAYLQMRGLEAPSKSSCTFCPFHNTAAWQDMKREDGPDWKQAVEIDAAIRDKRPPYPLFVHRKCKPLSEAVVIPEDFGWTQLDLLASDDKDAECDSGYCFL